LIDGEHHLFYFDTHLTAVKYSVIIFTDVLSPNSDDVILIMNFLAHAYLSFGEKEILVGNMISDFVKGKAQHDFIPGIRKGIIHHRLIDDFTDNHIAVRKAKEVFKADYRLYSSPLVDIVFDHFVAKDAKLFNTGLKNFTENIYQILEDYAAHLPERFIPVFGYMKTENWLLGYQQKAGIEKSLRGLVRRATYLNDAEMAITLFNQHYSELEDCYGKFIEDVKQFAKEQLDRLLK
jgi:acyl carrier protein phosphodiesterase